MMEANMNYPRLLLLIASLALACPVVARGQQPQQQQLDALDKYAKEVEARGGQSLPDDVHNVAKAVYEADNFIWDSGSDKVIHRGGDEVAVALVHIIGSSVVTDLEIERICILLYDAFKVPDIIVNPRDRHPDVSLLLLESSKLHTNNPTVRDKISTLQSHLINLYKINS
jgi:hypothetical protein